MRIAVDARELVGQATGVGRYLREVLTEWDAAGVCDRHEIVLVAHRAPDHAPAGWREATRVRSGSGGTRWEQWDFTRALADLRPDVVFSPGYTTPLAAPAPVALAVHDVSFFAHPEWYTWREGMRRRVVTAWSARRARLVMAPSAFSAREIVQHLAVDAGRVRVVPLGVRPSPSPVAEARSPLVLYVGSLFQRRRIDVLIDAFRTVASAHPGARLEIVGANRTRPFLDFAARVAACGLTGRVTLRDWVDDATLHTLYAEASVFVFLSQYEGFGFTPLEAMAHGAVPVVLDTPVAREVYGDAAWHVADARGITARVAEAIATLLEGGAARDRLRRAAGPVLARYRWADTAAHVLRVVEEAAGA
ncbi:MAG: glycosyltransferase family 1 protein [Vicinamibacterales bacterium]